MWGFESPLSHREGVAGGSTSGPFAIRSARGGSVRLLLITLSLIAPGAGHLLRGRIIDGLLFGGVSVFLSAALCGLGELAYDGAVNLAFAWFTGAPAFLAAGAAVSPLVYVFSAGALLLRWAAASDVNREGIGDGPWTAR